MRGGGVGEGRSSPEIFNHGAEGRSVSRYEYPADKGPRAYRVN